MTLNHPIAKNKKTILVLASAYLLSFATYGQTAPVSPDPANIPRPEALPPPLTLPTDIRQQEKPAYQQQPADQDVKLTVQTFTFSGIKAFGSAQLGALLKGYTNREIGLKDLNGATKIITDYYRKNGYFLAQAYLPAQDIRENTVEIAVLEGNLGELKLSGAENLDAGFLGKIASYDVKSGDAVTENNVVRNVTILNSLPATRATAQLTPGAEVGSTDAEVTMQPLPRWSAYLAGDTYGNRYTGREVAHAGVRLNNAAGLGDQLVLQLKSARDEGERGLQLGYYTPVHASGTLLSLNYNYVDYKLGGTFKVLGASGDSQYFNIGLDQPIIRSADRGLTARIGGAYKRVNDEVTAFVLKNRRDVTNFDVGLFGDWFDEGSGSSNQLGINLRAGRVDFKNAFAQNLDATGAKTEGDFLKYNLTATRVQYFKNGVSIALRADYQGSDSNLDSVEKMSIGGINRWRAFAELPSLADGGLMAGAEIRKKIVANESLARLLLVDISPYAFVDAGRGKVNQNALNSDNHVKAFHYGFGVDFALVRNWQLNVAVSHQNRDFDGASAENTTRFWGQLQKEF